MLRRVRLRNGEENNISAKEEKFRRPLVQEEIRTSLNEGETNPGERSDFEKGKTSRVRTSRSHIMGFVSTRKKKKKNGARVEWAALSVVRGRP
jgi:hypothetical protein